MKNEFIIVFMVSYRVFLLVDGFVGGCSVSGRGLAIKSQINC